MSPQTSAYISFLNTFFASGTSSSSCCDFISTILFSIKGGKKLTTSALRFKPAAIFAFPPRITRFQLPTTLTPACTLTSNLGLGRPPQPLPKGEVGKAGRLRSAEVRSELMPGSGVADEEVGGEGMWMVLQ